MRAFSWSRWLPWAIACIAAASACSSSSGRAGGTTTPSGYCQRTCAKTLSCDRTTDAQTCANTCSDGLGAAGPKLRADLLGYIATCEESLDCASAIKSGASGSCRDEAVAELAPTSAGNALCAKYESADSACGVSFDKSACFAAAKTYNDAALQAAESCLAKACTDLDACVQSSLGGFTLPGEIAGAGAAGASAGGTGGASSTGGAAAGGAGGSHAGGAGGAAGGGGLSGPCLDSDPTACADATHVIACFNGSYASRTCDQVCTDIGFTNTGCSANACGCDMPTDADCSTGAQVICACVSGGCTSDQETGVYINCFTDYMSEKVQIQCAAKYATGTTVDCAGASVCVQ